MEEKPNPLERLIIGEDGRIRLERNPEVIIKDPSFIGGPHILLGSPDESSFVQIVMKRQHPKEANAFLLETADTAGMIANYVLRYFHISKDNLIPYP